MNDPIHPGEASLSRTTVERIDRICDRFEAAWKAGQEPRVEDYLELFEEPERSVLLCQLLLLEWEYRAKGGTTPVPEEYHTRFPDHPDLVDSVLSKTCPPEALSETVARSELGTGARAEHATPAEPELPAEKLGRFELIERVGRGAFGSVYRARDPRLDREVALKIPRAGTLVDDEDRERFSREARAAAQLRHSHIVPVHEAGEIENTSYIASDFVEGSTLRHHLKQQRRFTHREAALLVGKLARALHYAHGKGIVHRDIKPENIMLDADGEPQITDFGLAHREHGETLQTQEGMRMGTPAYMSPEQARGQSHLVDGRSDLWSLGVMLYEFLAATRPFCGQEADLLFEILDRDPLAPRKLNRSIPKDLETICLKCLAKDPNQRYPSCRHLAEDLDRFCAGDPIAARRQSRFVRACRKVARRPVLSGLIATALLAMAVGGYLVVRAQQDRQRAQQDREATRLAGELQSLFDAGDWSSRGLAAIDAKIAELEHRAPEMAVTCLARLVQTFSDDIKAELARGALQPEDIARVEGWLQAFEPRDPGAVERLRQAFQRRLRTWETAFDLSPPFSDLDIVFDAGKVKAAGDALDIVEAPANEPILCTRVASPGRAGLEVVFDPSWEKASRLGLVLDATPVDLSAADRKPSADQDRGYRFLLRAIPRRDMPGEPNRELARWSFSAVRGAGGRFAVEIFRGQSRLERRAVEPGDLPAGPLRLKVTRAGHHLQFEIGGLQPVEFWDPFAYRGSQTGVFAVQWPPNVLATHLQGFRQALPESPTPLEHGDSLYAQGAFREALATYQRQSRTPGDAETGQQARFKAAMCLLALERASEADAILGPLAAEPGERWPALAACQLWLRQVRQRQLDKAYTLFESLSLRYRTEELALLIPSELREEILGSYISQTKSVNLYKPNTNAVRDCERAVAIAEFFKGSSWTVDSGSLIVSLIRAHRAAGDEKQALEVAKKALSNCQPGAMEGVVGEYCWMLRVAGRPEEALKEIDDWLAQIPAGRSPPHWATLERVRVLAALDRWEEAEAALHTVIQDISPERPGWCYTSTWALLGFVREHLGDPEGAQQAWKEGLRVDWKTPWFGFRFTEGLILASLTEELTESDTEALVKRFVEMVAGDVAKSALLQSQLRREVKFITSVLRNVFRTPRGREYAHKIVFKEIPFEECMQMPVLLIGRETIRQGAMSGELTGEQDAVVWKLLEDGYAAVSKTGAIGKLQLIQLIFTWKGTTGFAGWAGVAPRLDPQVRGPTAYVMGHRYLHHLKQPEEAVKFFQTALKDAPPASPLEKLARAELDRLAPKSNKNEKSDSRKIAPR